MRQHFQFLEISIEKLLVMRTKSKATNIKNCFQSHNWFLFSFRQITANQISKYKYTLNQLNLKKNCSDFYLSLFFISFSQFYEHFWPHTINMCVSHTMTERKIYLCLINYKSTSGMVFLFVLELTACCFLFLHQYHLFLNKYHFL